MNLIAAAGEVIEIETHVVELPWWTLPPLVAILVVLLLYLRGATERDNPMPLHFTNRDLLK